MTNPDASPFPSDYSDSDDSDGERKIADDPTPKHAPMLAGSAAALAMLKKNSRNFRVNREMREKIVVYNPFLDEF